MDRGPVRWMGVEAQRHVPMVCLAGYEIMSGVLILSNNPATHCYDDQKPSLYYRQYQSRRIVAPETHFLIVCRCPQGRVMWLSTAEPHLSSARRCV